MIAVDTNLLVYAHQPAAPEHQRARQALERAALEPRGWGFSFPVLAEFWAVVTHAASARAAPDAAAGFLHGLLREGGAQVWAATAGVERLLVAAAARRQCRGRGIFDLQIALIALANGATEVWTHDAAFPRLPGLKLVDPLAVSREGYSPGA